MAFVAMDLGGTKIYTVLCEENGEILAEWREETLAREGPDKVLQQIKKSVNQVLHQGHLELHQVRKMGICIAGYFDFNRKVLVYSPNIQGWNQVPLEELLSNELGLSVLAENDANAAAFGEVCEGSAKGMTEALYVTVSTGIGAGWVCRGKIYRGSQGFAGEIGHMKVRLEGELCGCGGKGCLETEASGTAIARKARQRMAHAKNSWTAEDVFKAAQKGDSLADSIIREAIQYLGMGLANAVNMLNPQVIVVGGGVAMVGPWFLEPLEKEIRKNAVPALTENLMVRQASLGEASGVRGMIHLLKIGKQ